MLKLYRFSDSSKEYWETWKDHDGNHTVHWGELGTRGQSKTVKPTRLRKVESVIQKKIDELISQGFESIDKADHVTLMIEYEIKGMGSVADLEKRHRLEDRMN